MKKTITSITLIACLFALESSAREFKAGEKVFSKLDTNNSSYIEKDEFRKKAYNRFEKIDKNANGVISSDEVDALKRRAFRLKAWVKKNDTNNDGQVTKSEFESNLDNSFAKLDTNKDNKLSKDEFKITR